MAVSYPGPWDLPSHPFISSADVTRAAGDTQGIFYLLWRVGVVTLLMLSVSITVAFSVVSRPRLPEQAFFCPRPCHDRGARTV
jgi:hypothetical protein